MTCQPPDFDFVVQSVFPPVRTNLIIWSQGKVENISPYINASSCKLLIWSAIWPSWQDFWPDIEREKKSWLLGFLMKSADLLRTFTLKRENRWLKFRKIEGYDTC